MISGSQEQKSEGLAEERVAEAASARSFFWGYQPGTERFDELHGKGRLGVGGRFGAEHWQRLERALGVLGRETFLRLWQQTKHALRENGIAYGSSGVSEDVSRPWHLDPIPLVIPAAEWEGIAEALSQRARLLGEILADLMGPQRLVTSGLLPAEVIFRHPLFHRALWSERAPQKTPLVLYAADIARDPRGKWWVLGDRTEAPSGLGFALENRLLMSRMLPAAFHSLHVRRLASFFIDLRESMNELCFTAGHCEGAGKPRIVLLTRGERSARYFEDTFLARYLGYTLAEGEDLAVRGDRLVFRTLGGLLGVDGVFRRPDSRTLDSLEILSGQNNGTAGLLQAWRLGHFGMVNPPGSGLVEAPVLMSFLPFLCQQMFGEPLRMPAVATWWLGAEAIRKKVLRKLDDLVIKPAFERPGPVADAETARLARLTKTQLLNLIESRPYDFVAQERVERSLAPIWCGGGDALREHPEGPGSEERIGAGTVVVRLFQVQRGAEGEYQTMQGGLVRCQTWNLPSRQGGHGDGVGSELCKDLWVLANEPVRHVTLLEDHPDRIELRRGGAELPSRVADNLFWVGRLLERTEGVGRLLRSVVVRLTGEETSTQLPEMSMLLRGMVEQNQIEPDYAVPEIQGGLQPLEQVLPRLVCDPNHHGGLHSRTQTLVRTASTVRDRISADSWRAIRKVGDVFAGVDWRRACLADVLELANETILSLASFSGLASESMTRTTTWRFLDLGRRIERASQMATILHCASEEGDSMTTATFIALLENAESLMTYRSRYQSGFRWGPVCDLLICDPTNPRSIAYQLVAITDHISQLPRELYHEPDEELFGAATQMVRLIESLDPSTLQTRRGLQRMTEIVSELVTLLPQFSDAINHRYFVHTPTQRLLGGLESAPAAGGEGEWTPILSQVDRRSSSLDPRDWGGGAI